MLYGVGGGEGDFECEVWRWVVNGERCIVKGEGWCRKVNGVGDVVVCAFLGGDGRGANGDGYRWKVKGEWCNVGEVECDGEGVAEVWKVIGERWKVKGVVVGLVLAFIPYLLRSIVCCCMVSPFIPFLWPISLFFVYCFFWVPLFLFRLLLFLCSFSVCLSFFGLCSLCRGGECECVLVMFTASFLLFPFSRVSFALSPS